jgi:hypothetical protein
MERTKNTDVGGKEIEESLLGAGGFLPNVELPWMKVGGHLNGCSGIDALPATMLTLRTCTELSFRLA